MSQKGKVTVPSDEELRQIVIRSGLDPIMQEWVYNNLHQVRDRTREATRKQDIAAVRAITKPYGKVHQLIQAVFKESHASGSNSMLLLVVQTL